MSHQPHNNKGWLRQFIPMPSKRQLEFFIERLGIRSKHLTDITEKQLEDFRQAAFRDLTGSVQ